MMAEQENWPRTKTMKYFNDRIAFEKFFTKWEKKQLGIEERVPDCVKRLDLDAK